MLIPRCTSPPLLNHFVCVFYCVSFLSIFSHDISLFLLFFFFNDPATTEIYTLSLHDALPISFAPRASNWSTSDEPMNDAPPVRSEEHTSELQSPVHLVCRLLLEKKKKKTKRGHISQKIKGTAQHKRTNYKSISHTISN